MRNLFTFFLFIISAVETKAADQHFPKWGNAIRVTVTCKAENHTNTILIAQYCSPDLNCPNKTKAGVSLEKHKDGAHLTFVNCSYDSWSCDAEGHIDDNVEKIEFNVSCINHVPSTTPAAPDETHTPSIKQTDVPSTTPAAPDETHTPSIKQTELPHTTKMTEAPTGEALSTEAIVGIAFVGALALGGALGLPFIVDVVRARRAGRVPTIARVFLSLRRKLCDPEPNNQVQNPIELDDFIPVPDQV